MKKTKRLYFLILLICLCGMPDIMVAMDFEPSSYAAPEVMVPMNTMQSPSLSPMDISNSSFDAYGSIEEATTMGPRRVKRPDDNPIGEIAEESPIGGAVIPLLLLLASYLAIKSGGKNEEEKKA